MIEANIQESNDDDMKIEEDEIDKIIKTSTKRKSTFVSENLREKIKDFESSFDSEVKVFGRRPLYSRKKFKKANTDKVSVCSCHVTYAFESESTLRSCLNGKELLARSRREMVWPNG